MMKKTLKQLVCLMLTFALVFSLVGCGTDDKETTKAPSNETSAPTDAPTQSGDQGTTEAPTEAPKVGITYPLDTKETITLWTQRMVPNEDYKDATESPYHQGLIKNTGVNIEFSYPMPGQNANEAYKLLLTEKVLPDVIQKATSNADLYELYEDGVLRDLTPYLEEYAPDYWKFLQEHDDARREIMTSDGKVLAFWGVRDTDWSINYIGPMIRQDWLDEQNLEAPVTLADWENVLTVFKEKYNATFGFSSKYLKYCLMASGTGAMATGTQEGTYFVDKNGKVQMSCLQPEWKEYMEIMNRWYEKGLLDNDSMTADDKTIRTKAANNQLGASWGPMSQMSNFWTDAEANGNGAKWVGVSYPRTAPGEPTSVIQYGAATIKTGAWISKDCSEEKMKMVMQFLNYGYTEEGMMYNNFGELGVSYTLDSEGNPQFTDLVKNDKQGISNAVKKYTSAYACPIGVQMGYHVRLKNHDEAVKAVDKWLENTTRQQTYLPSLEFTQEETDINATVTGYTDVINENVQKFIMGARPIEEYDDFCAELKKLGVEKLIATRQSAWDRYSQK